MSYEALIEGYRAFQTHGFEAKQTQYQHLAEHGQNPKVMCISCADSRVDPLAITQSGPGHVFAIRNVANLVPAWSSQPEKKCLSTESALRYGVLNLEVEHLLIMGHAHCGGIRALIETPDTEHSEDPTIQWVHHLHAARCHVHNHHPDATTDGLASMCEKQGLRQSQTHLMTYPFIAERVARQQLAIHLWHFDIATGHVEVFDAQTQQFIPL